MIRKIIQIDEEKCNGCGACAAACHEGAIGMIEGKAKLLRDDYCDGLGDCLPACPTGAITFIEREADEYNEAAVMENKRRNSKSINRKAEPNTCCVSDETADSQLQQWPVQIKLVPVNAPYFDDAKLLVAADCTAYAYANFHNRFIRNHITLIGCPKLDSVDYTGKLADIIRNNNIKSVTVVRMEVPCCGGIENAVKNALMTASKSIPWNVVTISTDGRILAE